MEWIQGRKSSISDYSIHTNVTASIHFPTYSTLNSMLKIFNRELTERQIFIAEMIIICAFAIIPAFASYPFRINIFLSYEGAYRMYLGQMPFRDFGIPVGYGYWIIPFMFFKIFGPSLGTLVKAQVFINIISGLGFRS